MFLCFDIEIVDNAIIVVKLMTSAIFSYTVQRYMNFGSIGQTDGTVSVI